MDHANSESLAEALKLPEGAAKQKKDELRSILSDKYTHLRRLILETDSSITGALASAKDHAIEAGTHAKDAGVAKARDLGREVDQSVHQNPWPYIAGSAAIGVLLGALLGRDPK